MSMLYPEGDPLYRKLRPNLALSGGQVFTEDNRLFWHPALSPLAQLHSEGKVTVLPAIGYDHPDQSHFTSRHYWEVGATDADLRTGWLGRYLDIVGTSDNPLQGLSMTGQLEPSLATAKVPVAAINGPDQYTFWSQNVWGSVQKRMLDAVGGFGALAGNDPALQTAANVAVQADRLRRQLLPFADKTKLVSPVPYPKSSDSFPSHLQGVAAMIGAGLPMRVVALEAGGEYDTHSGEPAALSDRLRSGRHLAAGVPARSRSASPRRPRADARLDGVRPPRPGERLAGDRPRRRRDGLPDRDESGRQDDRRVPRPQQGPRRRRQPKATSDFRGIYGSLLEQWLSFDAEKVIPGAHSFARPKLIRA